MMQNTRYIEAMNQPRNNIFLNTLGNGRYNSIADDYAGYRKDGYTIYDVVAEGGFLNLSAKTPGKYLCVWVNGDPTGTYNIYYSDFSPHTSVVVMGLKLTSNLKIDSYNLNVSFAFKDYGSWNPTYYDKYIFKYINMSVAGDCFTAYSGFMGGYGFSGRFLNCVIEITESVALGSCDFYNCETTLNLGFLFIETLPGGTRLCSNCRISGVDAIKSKSTDAGTSPAGSAATTIKLASSASATDDYYNGMTVYLTGGTGAGQARKITDYTGSTKTATVSAWGTTPDSSTTYIIFNGLWSQANAGSSMQYRNIEFIDLSGAYNLYLIYIDTQNVLAKNCLIRYDGEDPNANEQTIYIDNSTITPSSYIDYVKFLPAIYPHVFCLYQTMLNYTTIDNSANYIVLGAVPTYGRKTYRGSIDRVKHNFYSVAFKSNIMIDDDFKNFDDEDVLVVNRDDVKGNIEDWIIKDFKFRLSGVVQSYRNDESFLIIVQASGTSIYSVVAWHKNNLMSTGLGDIMIGVEYDIIRVIQVWEMPEEIEIRNIYNIADSPLEGTVRMKDATSKWVIS